jgi:hypothetical protein
MSEQSQASERSQTPAEGKSLRNRCERILQVASLEPYDFRASCEPSPRQRLHAGHGEPDGMFVLKVNNTAALRMVLLLLEKP